MVSNADMLVVAVAALAVPLLINASLAEMEAIVMMRLVIALSKMKPVIAVVAIVRMGERRRNRSNSHRKGRRSNPIQSHKAPFQA